MKKTVLMMAAAFALMTVSCGNKQAEQSTESSKEAKTEKVKEKKKKAPKKQAQKEAKSVPTSELEKIERVWISNPIDVDSGDLTADIEIFACAFCDQYPDYEPNGALYSYLIDPRGYDPEENGFFVDNQKGYGYLAISHASQYDWSTTCCYWKRNNGHKLFAVWMSDEHEDTLPDAHLLLFYDYDPATDVLTPEPKLTRKVEKAMEDYDDYSITLPAKGKDIEVVGYVYAHDSADADYFMLHWNGYDFEMAAG